MGKQRRVRTKYHFSSNKDKEQRENNVKSIEAGVSGFNLSVPDDVFENVNIDIDNVNKSIDNMNKNEMEEDSKSVRSVKSISKSIKSFKRSLGDIHLKKNEKRTLRRNLFLKKLQLSYDLSKKEKQKKKQGSSLLSISEMDEHLPSVNMLFHKPKPALENHVEPVTKCKPRGIMKAKDRKKSLMNNLDGFKKLLGDTKFKSNPLDAVTNCLEEKIFNENL